MFDGHYDDWRRTRINKIISLYGKEYFKDKTLLELACGFGHIGLEFQGMGSKVTFTDGRKRNLDVLLGIDPKVETIILNQNGSWDLHRKFDVVIHFGVLYHLEHWEDDLRSALNHFNGVMFLESEVLNSSDENIVKVFGENPDHYDQALDSNGSRPTANYIEKILKEQNVNFQRYDDTDLNSSVHLYDWKVDEQLPVYNLGYRRFWVITKNMAG